MVLLRHTRSTAARSKEATSKKDAVLMIVRICGVMFLFGLTWLFAILTFSTPGLREIFQILFTVFNSFQGFFIFIFLCVINRDAQESWKHTIIGKKLSRLLQMTSRSSHSGGNSTSNSNPTARGINPVGLDKGTNNNYKTVQGTRLDDLTFTNKQTIELYSQDSNKERTEVKEKIPSISESSVDCDDATITKQDQKGGDFNLGVSPLNIQVRRFSTRKEGKHHVEEVKIELHSDSDSESD